VVPNHQLQYYYCDALSRRFDDLPSRPVERRVDEIHRARKRRDDQKESRRLARNAHAKIMEGGRPAGILACGRLGCIMFEPMSLDSVAESYVRLTLAMGEIDPYHVDAYYGPAEWKAEASGQTLEHILEKARGARSEISNQQVIDDPRARCLSKQLDALIARAGLRAESKMTFDEESRAVYDVVAPSHPDSYYADIIKQIEPLLPGTAPLHERWEDFRQQFYIPAEKLQSVFTAGVDEARKRTTNYIDLPKGESFEIELVSNQVWGAYNWFKGNSHSLIQVNTDLPMSINRVIHLACHEGYPGHHVYNCLLEQHMVREKHWIEFTIYPLYSPESLIAEGTAEYGVELCFTPEERLDFETSVLYPLAGLDATRAKDLNYIAKLMNDLGNAGNDAGRRYIDGKASKEQTIEWLQTYALASPKRAAQNVAFFDAHRSYIVTYGVGEEMVRNYVERKATTSDEKWKVFTGLLCAPTVPSDLNG